MGNIPNHIALILDGNRRWAKELGKPAFFGHTKGMENAKKIVLYAQKMGVKVITMWGFSTENWSRSKEEVDFLMNLFEKYIDKNIEKYHKQGVKFGHIGSFTELPKTLQEKIKSAIEQTKNNTGIIANLALNYGGRDELKRTVQKLIKKGIKAEEVTVDLISENLDTAGLPDPDFIIRTSGEQRTSGFLTWQSAYSEWYFPKVHWPAFDEKEFDKALVEYSKRQRRFWEVVYMHILDVRVDEMNKKQAINQVADFLQSMGQYHVFTPNPEMIVKAQEDVYFKEVLNKGDLNLCDGFGVKLTGLLHGRNLARVPGVDFMIDICQLAAEQGKKVYLLGSGSDEVVYKTMLKLLKRFPNLKISGYDKGPEIIEGLARQLDDGILEQIDNSGAQILFVAFGSPKQEKWIYENLSRLPSVKMAMGVGGSFDFISGKIKRAPLFLRTIGLEWVYRLWQEPKRFKRIFNATVRFCYLVLSSKIR